MVRRSIIVRIPKVDLRISRSARVASSGLAER